MTHLRPLLVVLLGLILAPLTVGLLSGIDRKLTAKLQSRRGPSIFQGYWDVLKLFGKEPIASSRTSILCAWAHLFSAAFAFLLFALRGDLLLVFFVQAVGAVFLVIGAMSVPSPFSQLGAQRELMQILAYEPILIVVFFGMYLVTGSFSVSAIAAHPAPLLLQLPLLYVALGYALTIKLRKSPFDLSTSHHAHQELVKGVLTEYSGPFLALVEVAHWFEVALVLGVCGLFWATNPWIALALVAATYLLEILVDNTTARVTWRWMLRSSWGVGLVLTVANVSWLYFAKR